MVDFDPGPPPEVAGHFDKVPSYAKRRNTVERDPADLLHTLIWRAPAG